MSIVGQVERHECWTIEVEPSPAIVGQSQRWLARWRGDYHKFTQALFYEAVDAIQGNVLHRRREELELEEGCARYFFRRDRRERHRICITVERIDFFHPDDDFDPDPNGGETALHPFEPLVIDLSSLDRRFTIDYVEGVWLKPRRTDSFDPVKPMYSVFWDDDARISTNGGHRGDYSTGLFAINRDLIAHDNRSRNADAIGTFMIPSSWKISKLSRHNEIYSSSHMAEPIDTIFGEAAFAPDHQMQCNMITVVIDGAGIQYSVHLPDISSIKSSMPRTQQLCLSGSS